MQNYPNPFNPSTMIGYQLPSSGNVSLKVYDVLGVEVATLVNGYQEAGYHNAKFSIGEKNSASGIYFYTLRMNGTQQTKKMMFVK